jgi:hypothetical protein
MSLGEREGVRASLEESPNPPSPQIDEKGEGPSGESSVAANRALTTSHRLGLLFLHASAIQILACPPKPRAEHGFVLNMNIVGIPSQ